MKLRAPAVPLITCDPYFSVWSPNEHLNAKGTVHWTGKPNALGGYVTVDGENLRFLGYISNKGHRIEQTEMDIDALSTRYTFENEKIRLFVKFMTPLFPDDLRLLSRPVSYMSVSYESKDGECHDVKVELTASETLCLDHNGESPVVRETLELRGIAAAKMGNSVQNVLARDGDDIRINYGYFYLAAVGGKVQDIPPKTKPWQSDTVGVEKLLLEKEDALFLFAYDDIRSINYFGRELPSYWNKDGKSIEDAIEEAAGEYKELSERADDFSDKLFAECYMAGGEKYADLCSLAYRQAIAAHKLAVDGEDILFISKECFSNGCAATVDVSYPSIPLFLRYNTELVKAMLRPIYKFAATEEWKYDFAPHDAGRFPKVCGQVYGFNRTTGEHPLDKQMPVEECGNMIIMETNIALANKNADFAAAHIDTLIAWCEYLIKYGDDPENQLCTDDFAGHLAHNCNLTLKAIMGIEGMSVIMKMLGRGEESEKYDKIAREKAKSWCLRAENADGSYKLAFDKDGSFSMKYNAVWDKIWGTGLFPERMFKNEIDSNFEHFDKYGMPLDSRSDYTKSDWLVWCATMAGSSAQFKRYVAPLWHAYNDTPDRVPMTDWYDTKSACKVGFVARSVIGGLFIKALEQTDILKV